MSSGHSKVPIILVLESDHETRPLLVENLSRNGYQLMVAIDEEEALIRLRDSGKTPTLILINQVGFTIEEILGQGQRLRQAANPESPIPIVIMADRYGADLEGTILQSDGDDYVIYPEDAQQLLNLLWRLCWDA